MLQTRLAAVKSAFYFTYERDWRAAPAAFWVHKPVFGVQDAYEPPAPMAIPRFGYAILHVVFGAHELQFSALAQLEHVIDVLSRKPLPTSRQLSCGRGVSVGPNGHWLSRFPRELKSPRKREKLVRMLSAIHVDIAGRWSK
ncbi:hypothetical protein [Chitinolyticbacter meiyuanensis]|uniref:hypothetical protein n=1 Tax=Chitinolyticbacter meiyuanensis TaxID=682798 RepID=UPI00165235E0|nr:hypothetical protein [Chitinolyticbacter meiyuanensis]